MHSRSSWKRYCIRITLTENLPYQFEDETIYRLKVSEKVPEEVPNGALPIKNHFLIVEVLEKNVACPELEELLTEYRKPVVIKDKDLFFGHSIAVNGSPKKGVVSADIEG